MKMLKVTGNNEHQKLYLRGDPQEPEPAEVTLFFPGGYIGVSRCSDGKYWAHIFVNDKEHQANNPDCDIAIGTHSDARIDCRNNHSNKMKLGDLGRSDVYHFAVKIKPQG